MLAKLHTDPLLGFDALSVEADVNVSPARCRRRCWWKQQFVTAVIPEPASLLMAGTGLFAVIGFRCWFGRRKPA